MIRKIIKWTAIIVIIAGGTTFAMVSPMFNIQDIQVNNVNRISADTVISLSGLTKGQNIFRFFKMAISLLIYRLVLPCNAFMSAGALRACASQRSFL